MLRHGLRRVPPPLKIFWERVKLLGRCEPFVDPRSSRGPIMPPEDRVGLTASRLRLVQVQCADQGDEVRRQNLEEEVDRAMKTLSPDDRRGFLTRLLDEFPAWQADKVETAAPTAAAAPVAAFDKNQLS